MEHGACQLCFLPGDSGASAQAIRRLLVYATVVTHEGGLIRGEPT
jgi:hypothetical protein